MSYYKTVKKVHRTIAVLFSVFFLIVAVTRKLPIEGEAAQTIAEFATQGNFDLIVMGARGLSNLQGILLGSVSQKVLNPAKCPVLVVK